MQLTINSREYDLNFGVRFVRELDKNVGLSTQGINFGMGLLRTLPALKAYDPAVLSDVIHAATVSNKKRPSASEVDDYIDTEPDLEPVFEQVHKEMTEANAVKAAVKNMKA